MILDVSRIDDHEVEIVDGQQRLTTLFLLLIACRDHARFIKATQQAEKTQTRITFTGAILNETIGMKLIASDSIRHTFEMMASSEWDTKFPDQGHKLQVRKLKLLYTAFREHLSHLDANELAHFQTAILAIRVMRIDIDAKEEAFSIFERTNARGLDLEVADLMKNYLYQTAGATVGEVWNKVRTNAGHAMLRMLKSFYVAHKGYIQKAELYKSLRKYAESLGGGNKLATEILEFSEFFRFTQNVNINPEHVREYFATAGLSGVAGKQDRILEAQASFQSLALFKVKQAQALIFASMLALRRLGLTSDATAAKAFTRMLHALECFHFINTSVCSHIGNEVEHLYADLCVEFAKSKDFVRMVDSVVGQLRKRRAPKMEFIGNFRAIEYSVVAKPKLAYIFDRFNNLGRSPGERKVIFFPERGEFDKSLNIEHVFAQNAPVTEKPRPTLINNVGNLIVIGRQLNSKLGNRSVKEKFAEMQGPSASRVAEFPAVCQLIAEFASHALEWNDEVILKRADSLANLGYEKVWSF